MKAKKLRVGILGAGGMGRTHAQQLVRRENIALTAICGRTAESTQALREKLRVLDAKVFTDFDQMLGECPMDVLYVCLPPFAHEGQVEKAAAKGIHLFLEKPIALTVSQAREMVAAIEKAGVVSQVGYHYRFHRGVERFRQLMADGKTGMPTLFEGRYWCRIGNDGGWWPDKTKSGGQIVEQLIHIYDLALHLFGPAESVTGVTENLTHQKTPGYTVEDTSVGIVRFKNGAMACITGSNCAMPVHFMGDYRIVCDRAMLEFRTTGQSWVKPDECTVFTHDGVEKVVREEFQEDRNVYGAETDEFLSAVVTGGKTRTPAREGLNSLKVVAAVTESAAHNGKMVRL